jgi:hypothetical protein
MSIPRPRQTAGAARTTEVAPVSTRTLVQAGGDCTVTSATPALARARRALIRIQAARTTRRMIAELEFHLEPPPGRQPLFVHLDALKARYEALGGEPSDLER